MKSLVVAIPQTSPYCSTVTHHSSLKSNVMYFFKRYGLISFFIAALFAGMIYGAVRASSADEDLIDKLDVIFSTNVAARVEQSLAETFTSSFGTSFLFLVLLFCLSLSPFGVAAVPLLMFFRGFGYGISSGFLCVTYGFKGLVYYICVMLLGAFFSSLALVYAAQFCFDFAKSLIITIFGKYPQENGFLKNKLISLAFNCGYMVILIIFASLVDTVLYFLIGGLFSF